LPHAVEEAALLLRRLGSRFGLFGLGGALPKREVKTIQLPV